MYNLPGNDKIKFLEKDLIIYLNNKRNILSTGPINGGYREDLLYVINHDEKIKNSKYCKLKAKTYNEHMGIIIDELGIEKQKTTGLSTTVSIENTSIVKKEYKDLIVTAITTAGIDKNGGRAGDKATLYQVNEKFVPIGTINIILHINIRLTKEAMTRSIITLTEAKTAALQELLAPSKYSFGLATGSGTDGAVVISNLDSGITMTDAGKHTKLGELIALAVKESVKEALDKQTGLNEKRQYSILSRVERYNINKYSLYKISKIKDLEIYTKSLYKIDKDKNLIVKISLYIHLLDQYRYNLLPYKDVLKECINIINQILNIDIINIKEIDYKNKLDYLIDLLKHTINRLVLNNLK